MKKLKHLFLLIMSSLALLAHEIRTGKPARLLANEVHGSGNLTRKAEAAFGVRNLLAKKGTADDEFDICGVNDKPYGPCTDEPAIGDYVNISLLGNATGTLELVAKEAIGINVDVYTAAGGKVSLTGGVGTYLVGTTISSSAADGDPIEVQHTFPIAQ